MSTSPPRASLEVPDALIASHAKYFGERGRPWLAALPELAAGCLERWVLRRDGPPVCGAVALVLPVRLADRTPAVLKLQPVDEETAGEPLALRAWDGRGAVRREGSDCAPRRLAVPTPIADARRVTVQLIFCTIGSIAVREPRDQLDRRARSPQGAIPPVAAPPPP